MANRYAVATGNWSNTATWDGGTLPGAGDDVRSNGFTVTIDQSITVLSITNTALSPAVAGGGFSVNTTTYNNLTLNANITAGTNGLLTVTGTGVLNINGNINAGVNSNSPGITINSVCTLNITGNIYGSSSSVGWGGVSGSGINTGAACTLNITGNVYGGIPTQNSSSFGLQISGATIINMVGNAYALGSNAINITNSAAILTGNIVAFASTTTANRAGVETVSTNTSVVVNKVVNSSFGVGIGAGVRLASSNPLWEVILDNGTIITLSNPASTSPPAEADVRDGVIYGGGAYEGTLVVPIPADVRKGIATDNTVGTGIITGVDFFNLIATDSDPVAVRLRNVATVQTVGDQFNSF